MNNSSLFITDKLLIESLLLVKTAVAIHVGENAVIQVANDAMLAIWDKDKSVIGKSLEDALPELKGQPFIDLFKRVWNEGITISGTDTAAELNVNGELKTFYFDFEYRALLNDAGKTYCILHTATDVTDRVTGKLATERAAEKEMALEKEQHLNEELATINEELSSVVEELRQSEESLADANDELEQRVAERTQDLTASEGKLQSVLDTMAEGLAIIDLYGKLTYLNPKGQQILGISESEATARTYDDPKWEILTVNGEPLPDSVHPVTIMLTTGKPVSGYELQLRHPNEPEFFIVVNATPLHNANETMIGGIATFVDITERRNYSTRIGALNEELSAANEELIVNIEELSTLNNQLEETKADLLKINANLVKSELHLYLAAEAAKIGIWNIEPETKVLNYNSELAAIFGYKGPGKMTYEQAIGQVSEEYREKITAEIEKAIVTNGDYDFTYSQRRFNDGELIWLRSSGKISKDEEGNNTLFSGVVIDITEQVKSDKALQQLNKDLTLANAELADKNRKMVIANEQLIIAKQSVESQRELLNKFFMQAPAGICVLAGPDLIYQLVNPGYQKLLPNRILLNRPLFEALPELVGTPLQDIILNVYKTGEPYQINELLIPVAEREGGTAVNRYFTFNYMARRDAASNIDGILAYVYDVTEQVVARKKIADAEETLRLATEAASIGTFDMDLEKGLMDWDKRCRTLFGISHNHEVTYEHDFVTGLHPEDRKRVTAIVDDAFNKQKSNGNYDVEYRTIGAEDQKLRWVRARGKVYFNEHDKPVRFLGSVLEITEQKLDDQRKNDFIGMVSHELKTPLTSLSAYVQMLAVKANKTADTFTIGALDKANKQIRKMTTMINGFLNVARLEAGKIHIDAERFDMASLVAEIKEEINVTVTSHNVLFAPVEETFVNADREKIGQVINNFISNAVKYSSAGTTIQVACIQKNGCAEVCVKDHGFGISAEDQEKLFDRFYRVDNRNTHTISGFGIGLYLSAEIIHRHQGKIWVESEPGKGSTFYFSIPM